VTHRHLFYITWTLCGIGLCQLAGCGAGATDPPRQSVQDAFRNGQAALEQGNHNSAESQLRFAIESGALQPDDYCQALMLHGVALARLQRFDEAYASLDRATQGAADLASVQAARAAVLQLQGKTAEADRAFAEAKKLNPQVKPFKK